MKTKTELQAEREQLQQDLSVIDKQLEEIEEQEKRQQNSFMELDTFEKCCAVTGDDPKNPKFHTGDDDTQAYEMLKVITKAINGGKKFGSASYTPWFDETKTPGSGFFYDTCTWAHGYVVVSSRLRFIDSGRALFAGKTFEKIYYRYMV